MHFVNKNKFYLRSKDRQNSGSVEVHCYVTFPLCLCHKVTKPPEMTPWPIRAHNRVESHYQPLAYQSHANICMANKFNLISSMAIRQFETRIH